MSVVLFWTYPIRSNPNELLVTMWNGQQEIVQRGGKLFIPIPGVTFWNVVQPPGAEQA